MKKFIEWFEENNILDLIFMLILGSCMIMGFISFICLIILIKMYF